MFATVRELCRPTAVDCAVYGNFTGTQNHPRQNLAISQSNYLSLYDIVQIQGDQPDQTRLHLVRRFRLDGYIASMGLLKSPQPKRPDLLMLCFSDAKISIVEYVAEESDLKTVSMHYYEHEKFREKALHWTKPRIKVDPGNRCAVMQFYDTKLAVLPFRQFELATDVDGDIDNVSDDDDDGKNMGKENLSPVNSKPPALPSFVIPLKQIDEQAKRMIDFVFLDGYYEPTLAVLYENNRTWTGRYSEKKDTVLLKIISLDLIQRRTPAIYSIDKLPSDCLQMSSVPKPLGGLLIVSPNALLHFDQGSSGTGCAVNGFAAASTTFVLKNQIDMLLRLEGSRHCYLEAGLALFSLQNGDLYTVQLLKDGRYVSKFAFEKLNELTVPGLSSVMIHLCKDLVFLGSLCHDSFLLSYELAREQIANRPSDPPSSAKKMKTIDQQPVEKPSSPVKQNGDDLDELDLFLEAAPAPATLAAVARPTTSSALSTESLKAGALSGQLAYIKIVDRITSTAPFTDLTVGESLNLSSERPLCPPAPNGKLLDLVGCSGYGHHSALTVQQRSIRPVVSSSFNLPDTTVASWTIVCQPDSEVTEQSHQRPYDSFIVISKRSRNDAFYTMIFQSGRELVELERSDFFVRGLTVAVGSFFNNTRVVQVYAEGIRVLDSDGKRRQEIHVTDQLVFPAQRSVGSNQPLWIREAVIIEPYIGLVLGDGRPVFVRADDKKKELVGTEIPTSFDSFSIASLCIYRDDNLLLPTVLDLRQRASQIEERNITPTAAVESPKKRKNTSDSDLDDLLLDGTGGDDDEEVDDLYKNTGSKLPFLLSQSNRAEAMLASQYRRKLDPPRLYCAMVTEDGELGIMELPSFRFLFHSTALEQFNSMVVDSGQERFSSASTGGQKQTEAVQEIFLGSIGDQNTETAVLVVQNSKGDVMVYRGFEWLVKKRKLAADRLSIRFRREEQLDFISRQVESEQVFAESVRSSYEHLPASPIPEQEMNFRGVAAIKAKPRAFISFGQMAGLQTKSDSAAEPQYISGLFVTGKRPGWLFVSLQREILLHPMIFDGPIETFSPFHNVNCDRGFIYFAPDGSLKIANLDRRMDYHNQWPIRKAMINNPSQTVPCRTAERLEYHQKSQKYCVVTFEDVPFTIAKADEYRETQEEEEAPELEEPEPLLVPDPGKFFPLSRKYNMELFSPLTWGPVDRVEFELKEHILCLASCSLDVKISDTISRKTFIVVGTAFEKGEDAQSRGKLYIYELIEVVPEPGRPETNSKIKLVKTEELKGPATSFCAYNGYLCVSLGQKLMLYSFETGDSLIGVAFLDTNFYVTQMRSINGMLAVGDYQKSLWLVGYQEDPSRLIILGRDYDPFMAEASGFVLDEGNLGLAVANNLGDIRLLTYEPNHMASYAGQKLLARGDFAVPTMISRFIRLSCLEWIRDKSKFAQMKQHGLLFGCIDGSVGFLMPLNEKAFRRLYDLSNEMINRLDHSAGLNPRAFRLGHQSLESVNAAQTKTILDGDFIAKFINLPLADRLKWARNKGTSSDRVINDLATFQTGTDFF